MSSLFKDKKKKARGRFNDIKVDKKISSLLKKLEKKANK